MRVQAITFLFRFFVDYGYSKLIFSWHTYLMLKTIFIVNIHLFLCCFIAGGIDFVIHIIVLYGSHCFIGNY